MDLIKALNKKPSGFPARVKNACTPEYHRERIKQYEFTVLVSFMETPLRS